MYTPSHVVVKLAAFARQIWLTVVFSLYLRTKKSCRTQAGLCCIERGKKGGVWKDMAKYTLPSHLLVLRLQPVLHSLGPSCTPSQPNRQLAVSHVSTLPMVPQHLAMSNAPFRYP